MGRKPHVVVLPLASKGHVNPMMLFSKLLAEQGIVITFIITEFDSKQILHSEKPCELLKAGLDIRFEELPDGLPANYNRTAHVLDLCESQSSTMGKPFDALLACLVKQEPPPSCILADTLLTFTLDSALKFGLPHASFWTQSAASFASSLMVAKGYRPPQGEVAAKGFVRFGLQIVNLNAPVTAVKPPCRPAGSVCLETTSVEVELHLVVPYRADRPMDQSLLSRDPP